MPDSLPPRLLARVERSLRKRITTDIHPHLLRCAAHARNQEEFMASAARLLLNPREREQWLASWARRAQRELELAEAEAGAAAGTDSSPAALDTTSPVGLDAPVQRSFHITPVQLENIREALAREIGPVASLLIDDESKRSESAAELLARLQTHLQDDHQRARFVNSSLSTFKPGT